MGKPHEALRSISRPAVEDAKASRQRAVALLREKGVRLPTFAELAEPARVPAGHPRPRSPTSAPTMPIPLNLYRVHWFNDRSAHGPGRDCPCTSSCRRR